MHFFYSLGIGGKGVIPNRERDRYGFGFYYIDVKNPTLRGLFQARKLLRDEYGFEAFYNVAITPWLQLTPDIQVVRGAQKEQFTIGQGPLLGLPFIVGLVLNSRIGENDFKIVCFRLDVVGEELIGDQCTWPKRPFMSIC